MIAGEVARPLPLLLLCLLWEKAARKSAKAPFFDGGV
jgi:hypothetical protein